MTGYVFIVTFGRTGSTLLQNIIGGIDGYHIAGENNDALRGLYLSYKALTAPEVDEKRGNPDTSRRHHPWHNIRRVDRERYMRRLAEVFAAEVIAPPPRTHRVIGFREVRYLHHQKTLGDYLDFMAKFFRPAKFVFNARAVDDVMRSGWWRRQRAADKPRTKAAMRGFIACAQDWHQAHPRQSIIVDYDRYTENPQTLSALFDFLGEDFSRYQGHISDCLQQRLNY